MPSIRWIIAAVLALVAGTLTHVASSPDAVAADGGFIAYVAAESKRGAPLELAIFNTTGSAMDLDLVLRAADGTEVINRLNEIPLGPRETKFVNLDEQLSRDLPRRAKPYRGPMGVEVCGTGLFSPDNVVLHVSQFYGRRVRPRGAAIFRPVWVDRGAP